MQELTHNLGLSLANYIMRQVFLAKPAMGWAGKGCQKTRLLLPEVRQREVKRGVSAGLFYLDKIRRTCHLET